MKLLTPFVAEPVTPPAPPAMTDDELLAFKEQFAELSLREPDPFKVALAMFPNDTGRALRAANEWPNDPAVKTFQKSFLDAEGEMAFLSTEAEDIKRLRKRADEVFSVGDYDNAAKFEKMYLEVRGRIQKPQVAVSNTVNQTVRVLVVKDHGTDDEWRGKLKAQQKRLINGDYTTVSAEAS